MEYAKLELTFEMQVSDKVFDEFLRTIIAEQMDRVIAEFSKAGAAIESTHYKVSFGERDVRL